MIRFVFVLVLFSGLSLNTNARNGDLPSPQKPVVESVGATEQRRTLLKDLLDQLKDAPDKDSAGTIENVIWKLWLRSGNPQIDAAMKNVLLAMRGQRYIVALRLLNSIVLRAPLYAEGWNKRATVLYLLKDYEHSLSDIEKVLSIEPRHFGALSGIALIKMAKGDRKGALKAYRRVLKVHPYLPGGQKAMKLLAREIEGEPI